MPKADTLKAKNASITLIVNSNSQGENYYMEEKRRKGMKEYLLEHQ